MPSEIIKCFLEQVVDCCDDFSNALMLILQYYDIAAIEEESMANAKPDSTESYGGDRNGREK